MGEGESLINFLDLNLEKCSLLQIQAVLGDFPPSPGEVFAPLTYPRPLFISTSRLLLTPRLFGSKEYIRRHKLELAG